MKFMKLSKLKFSPPISSHDQQQCIGGRNIARKNILGREHILWCISSCGGIFKRHFKTVYISNDLFERFEHV